MDWLAIAPNRKAVYLAGSSYWVLELGSAQRRTFGWDQVTHPSPTDFPGLFFADEAPGSQ